MGFTIKKTVAVRVLVNTSGAYNIAVGNTSGAYNTAVGITNGD